jgi:hypothetical protein
MERAVLQGGICQPTVGVNIKITEKNVLLFVINSLFCYFVSLNTISNSGSLCVVWLKACVSDGGWMRAVIFEQKH